MSLDGTIGRGLVRWAGSGACCVRRDAAKNTSPGRAAFGFGSVGPAIVGSCAAMGWVSGARRTGGIGKIVAEGGSLITALFLAARLGG